MSYVLVIHAVDSYPAWKAVFDRAADMRRDAGELSYQVLADEADADRVVHFSRWSSLADAHRFFESPELVELRRGAGVRAPMFIYLDEIERGVLAPG